MSGPHSSGLTTPSGYPPELDCPILHVLMTDPVIAADGHTCAQPSALPLHTTTASPPLPASDERSAIEQWLQINDTSPMTREHIHDPTLRPNRMAKSMIAAWRQANEGEVKPTPTQPITVTLTVTITVVPHC